MDSFHGIINALVSDTLGSEHVPGSLDLFRPELILCVTIVLMLLIRVFNSGRRVSPFVLAMAGTLCAAYAATQSVGALLDGAAESQEIFTGLLVYDSLTIFFRWILLVFVLLLFILSRITRLVSREDSPDFFCLVLGATLGMCLMASANHLLMVFLAIEMASVPSYVLAGLVRGRRQSSEASLKYAIYGAGAAGVMLYGISLLCGVLGSAHLPTIAKQLVAMDIPNLVASGDTSGALGVLMLGGLMLSVGLAFKLSVVPFHFWCPDVFEGASAEIDAFLSVASKAAALALLVRVTLGFGTVPLDSLHGEPQALTVSVAPSGEALPDGAVTLVGSSASSISPQGLSASASEALQPVRGFMIKLLAILAAVTCTFGNLAAYGQTNIKRLLAYSTIAHAGYMLMPVCAMLALVDQPELARDALAALPFYIGIYLFASLGSFAVVAFLRNATGSEEIADYSGLVRSHPVLAVCFALFFFSLIGLPPLAGFAGKLAIFIALVKAGGPIMMSLLVIAGLNTAISLVYYLRVVKVMTIDPEPDSQAPFSIGFFPSIYTLAMAVPVVVLGVWFDEFFQFARAASLHLFS